MRRRILLTGPPGMREDDRRKEVAGDPPRRRLRVLHGGIREREEAAHRIPGGQNWTGSRGELADKISVHGRGWAPTGERGIGSSVSPFRPWKWRKAGSSSSRDREKWSAFPKPSSGGPGDYSRPVTPFCDDPVAGRGEFLEEIRRQRDVIIFIGYYARTGVHSPAIGRDVCPGHRMTVAIPRRFIFSKFVVKERVSDTQSGFVTEL